MCVYPVAIPGAEAAWPRSASISECAWPISAGNRDEDKDKPAQEVLRQKQELGAECWQSPALEDGDPGVTLGVWAWGIVELLAYNCVQRGPMASSLRRLLPRRRRATLGPWGWGAGLPDAPNMTHREDPSRRPD